MSLAPGIEDDIKPTWRGVSHQAAFFVALFAGVVLFVVGAVPRATWAGVVYALSLAGMYGISAAYHRPTWGPKGKAVMRRLDHAGIFLLIAGTYTPVCLLGMPDTTGLVLLSIVWAGAVLGILHAIFFVNAFRSLNVVLYVILGCAAVPLLPHLGAALGAMRTLFLVAGGLIYVAGAVVYARRRPNPSPKVFGYHEVFHLFVIAASVLHFAAVYGLVSGTTA